MKSFKTLVAAGAAAASLGMVALPAQAGVEASVGASSLYLFRGIDVGGGSAAIAGDLTVSDGGFYASVWTSSTGSSDTDTNDGGSTSPSTVRGNGGEIDVIAGWSGDVAEGLGVDIGAINYIYPGNSAADSFGDLSEAYLGLSFAGVEVYYYKAVADSSADGAANGKTSHDSEYITLSYTHGAWTLLAGQQEFDDTGSTATYDSEYTHVDVTYAVSDNLSFTASKIVDGDDDYFTAAGIDDDTQVVVSYTLPVDIK